jgi:hypothetical protein
MRCALFYTKLLTPVRAARVIQNLEKLITAIFIIKTEKIFKKTKRGKLSLYEENGQRH